MFAYILKRILLMLPTLLGVLLITFAVIQFVPGGPVEQYLAEAKGSVSGSAEGGSSSYRGSQGVDPKRVEQIKALYGFDKPAHQRFFQMLGQFARFDLGKSFFQNKEVSQLLWEKLPVSISLGLWTFFISYLIAVPLGVAKAVRAGTRFDLVTTLLILLGYAIPGFVLGVALLVIFGGQLQWFPLRGLISSNWEELTWGAKIVDYLWHIAMPVTAMVLGSFAVTAMLTKNAFRLHWRVFHRFAADRNPVFARRAGAARLRKRDPARLSGGDGHAVFLYADWPGNQAGERFVLCVGRPEGKV